MTTVFTKIISGEFPGIFCWADEHCVAFASINPITDGHLLVVPRTEVAKFTEVDDELLAHLFRVAKLIGQAQEAAFNAPRAAVLVAGFEVPHTHIHVLPAWGETQLSFANAKAHADPAELRAAATKIRQALIAAGHGEFVPANIESL